MQFLIFCLFTATAHGQAITFESLNALLETRNARVAAAKATLSASQEREGYFARSFLPAIKLEGSQEAFTLGTIQKKQPAYGAEATLNIFNGGRDYLEERVRELESAKREAQEKKVFFEELEKARIAYWQILYLQEKIILLKNTLSINQQNLSVANRRIKSGIATDSDRFEFEMQQIGLEQELQEAVVELQSQKRALHLLLGISVKDPLDFPEKISHDHNYESTLTHQPQNHTFLLQENLLSAEQNYLVASNHRRAWWPKLDAFASFYQYNQREKDSPLAKDRKETAWGLRVSLSLSAGLESMREAASLIHEANAKALLTDLEERELETHEQNELAEMKLLHEQVHGAEENILRAERYYRLTQSEYGRGVKNSLDILSASEKLFQTQHKRLEILRKFQVAKTHLLSKMGQ